MIDLTQSVLTGKNELGDSRHLQRPKGFFDVDFAILPDYFVFLLGKCTVDFLGV